MKSNSLVDIFFSNVNKNPTASYVYLRNGETHDNAISHAELAQRATVLATWLVKNGFSDQRAMLVYPPGLDFVVAFLACLIAKTVAVPVAPAPLAGDKNKVKRMLSILGDCSPTIVMGVKNTLEKAPVFVEQHPDFRNVVWLTTDTFDYDNQSDAQDLILPTEEDLALLQYTSGSTAHPKGVMLTHKNLMHNLACWNDEGGGHTEQSKMVCWVPHFHDLGLLYGILYPLYKGITCYLLPAASVVQKPSRWLQAISTYRATHSMGPNFIYEHCVDKITPEECEGLDLTSWRLTLNAAEPIRGDTLRAFNKKFSVYGLSPNTLTSAYGLAEVTCLMTRQRYDEPIRSVRLSTAALGHNKIAFAQENEVCSEIVGCGFPTLDMIVKTVDPATGVECDSGRVGEVWVASDSVSKGYWERSQENVRTFGAKLSNDLSGRTYMRTGDLGFFNDGELYITGRIKDLIIVRGENYYPQDAECEIEQAHPAFKPSCCAVFSVERDKEEKIVIVQELIRHADRWPYEEMFLAARRAVGAVFDLPIEAIVLIRPGTTSKTSSGKIQRSASKQAYLNNTLQVIAKWERDAAKLESAENRVPSFSHVDVESFLRSRISDIAALPLSSVDPTRPFSEYGLGSIDATMLAEELSKRFSIEISPTEFYDYPNIQALAQKMVRTDDEKAETSSIQSHDDAIAVVGLACRFPGAEDAAAYWRLLTEGKNAITTRTLSDGQVRYGGFIDNVASFDNDFFSITNREAGCLDPQQRIAMEVAWHAMEDAGIKPGNLAGSRTGVFFGASTYDYGYLQLSEGALDSYSSQGSVLAVIANRIAYHFDFRGPSFVVDTACSSALTALHLACRTLRDGECDIALSGAVNLLLATEWDVALTKAGMLAPDGLCKTFDAAANGYVRSEGCGVVVLKRYQDAVRDGDRIYGAIVGSALNQDGRSNGLTAPNGNAQEALLKTALNNAGVSASEVGYIEAHGTGTALGDPIECNAIRRVLGERQQACYLGSVKGNIGHLEAAAGMAGLIKTLLSLHHGVIPPQVSFTQLNPLIDLGNALAIPHEGTLWRNAGNGRRYAMVSAFGFCGANASVVLSSASSFADKRAEEQKSGAPSPLPFVLTAKDKASLRKLAARYAEHVPSVSNDEWQDFVYTTLCRRTAHATRFFTTVENAAALAPKLHALADGSDFGLNENTVRQPRVAFVFSGPCMPLAGVGRQLYGQLPVFKEALDRCDATLRPLLGQPLAELLYRDIESADLEMRPALAQSLQFSLQYALSQTLQSFDIEPDVVMGYGLGEYAALESTGALSLEEALRLVYARGDLVEKKALQGETVTVLADEETVTQSIKDSGLPVDIVAINGRHNCVVGGTSQVMAAYRTFLGEYSRDQGAAQSTQTRTLPLPVDPAQALSETQDLDAIVAQLLMAQLSELGLFKKAKLNAAALNDWRHVAGMPDMYQRWLGQSLQVLLQHGYLVQDDDALYLSGKPLQPTELIWEQWDQQKTLWLADPQRRAKMALLDTTVRALPQILSGKVESTSVIFPDGSFSLVEGIYKNSLVSDYFNGTLAENLIAFIEERLRQHPNAQIRLIEIGAGTGGTSSMLFDRLAPYANHIAEYCYTDISNAFLTYAKQHYAPRAPYLATKLFNIEKDPAEQSLELGSYDVVIAANVLHATRDIRNTLRHAKALLHRHGCLMLNEISNFDLFTHMTFGMLEGWWMYADPALRIPGSPGLAPEGWRHVLEAEGFVNVQTPAQAAHALGQQIVMAHSDGVLQSNAEHTEPGKFQFENACHSALIEPIVEPFAAMAGECHILPTRIPFISSITGERWPEGKHVNSDYLARHLRQPVRFSDALETLGKEGVTLAIEIGSAQVLCRLGHAYLGDRSPRWVALLTHSGDDWLAVLECLGHIFHAGVEVKWEPPFDGRNMRTVSLPPYAFKQQNHWFQSEARNKATRHEHALFRTLHGIMEEESVEAADKRNSEPAEASVGDVLADIFAQIMQMPAEEIDRTQSFFEMGVDSISLMEFAKIVTDKYNVTLTPSEIFEEFFNIDLIRQRLEDVLSQSLAE